MKYQIIGGDGQSYGPYSVQELQALMRDGRVAADTRAAPEGTQEWRPIRELAEFSAPASTGVPPPLPPTAPATGGGSPTPAAPAPGMATASLVCGILGLVGCGPLLGIPAIICGHKAVNRIRQSNGTLGGLGMATTGMILGYVSFVFFFIWMLLAAIAIPSFIQARNASRKNACICHLRSIDGAKQQWALDNNKDGSAASPTLSQLMTPPNNYIRTMPVCRAGGTDSVGTTIDDNPTCTINGHSL